MIIKLDVSKENEELLKKLMVEGGFPTYRALFNNAMTLMAWYFNERRTGRIIASLDEENMKYKEVILNATE